MSKLKAAVIGLGVGEAHIQAYQSHPNCEVVALCDLAEPKRKELQKKYTSMRVTADACEILKDPAIDVVSIASYDSTHFEQIAMGIEYGKHLFVEKPVCVHRSEAEKIQHLLTQHPKLKITSNLILRKSPRFQRLRDMICQNKLGQIYYVEGDYDYGRVEKITEGWRGREPFYSIVNGGAVHLIDLLLWVTGQRVKEVVAYGNQMVTKGSGFRFNDCVTAILKFESGALGKITANFGCVRPHFHAVSIYGDAGTFINEVPHAKWYTSRDPKVTPALIEDAYPGASKGDLVYEFIDSIVKGSDDSVSWREVLDTMSICFAIEESVEQNRPVEVRYL